MYVYVPMCSCVRPFVRGGENWEAAMESSEQSRSGGRGVMSSVRSRWVRGSRRFPPALLGRLGREAVKNVICCLNCIGGTRVCGWRTTCVVFFLCHRGETYFSVNWRLVSRQLIGNSVFFR